jgi:hypothetical protein
MRISTFIDAAISDKDSAQSIAREGTRCATAQVLEFGNTHGNFSQAQSSAQ